MKITKNFLENLIKSQIQDMIKPKKKINEEELHDIVAQSIEDSLNGIARGNIRRMERVRRIIDEETSKTIKESFGAPADDDLPPWRSEQDVDPLSRAQGLANQGMEQAAQMAKSGLGIFDGALEDGTPIKKVLDDVRKALNIPGQRPVLQKFDLMLSELGIELGEPERNDGSGPDVDADDVEDSLGRAQSTLSGKE